MLERGILIPAVVFRYLILAHGSWLISWLVGCERAALGSRRLDFCALPPFLLRYVARGWCVIR